ncbi:MAG: hypothetical protein RL456_3031 [Pseudomonadota bacterium]|jgi:putative hemolysin
MMRDFPLPTRPLADLQHRALRAPKPRPPATPTPAQATLQVSWARHLDEVRAAQRLRHAVFADEMGARLTPLATTPAGHDEDRHDAHCEHLLVRLEPQGEVIGTYRVMTPEAARRAGGWYSDTEFDFTPLAPLRDRVAELGRSCVHPDHRHGGVILALWGALGAFMQAHHLDTMVGCASLSMRDGGHVAASLWERLRQAHMADPTWHVQPRLALPLATLRRDLPAEPPALIRGYLRCGAKLLGPPAWDPDFRTADLPMMLRLDDLPDRHRRHLLGH